MPGRSLRRKRTLDAEPRVVPKMGPPSFTPLHDKSNVVTTIPSSATKSENPPFSQPEDEVKKAAIPPSSQIDDESVMKKAKATIAAKMENPNSVEFEDWEPGKMRLVILSTPSAASLETKTADPNRFCISSKKTKRISAATP